MAASAKIEVQERHGQEPAAVLTEYTPGEGETEYSVPEGVTEIAPWAFSACGTLERIFLPKSLRVIGEYAFDHCAGIREIVIPEYVMTIGTGAFHACASLRRVCCQVTQKPEGWVEHEVISCCTEDCARWTEIWYYSWLFGIVIRRICTPGAARDAWRHTLGTCRVVWNYAGH